MSNEKKRDYRREYVLDKANTKYIGLKMSVSTDSDIINQIEKRTGEGYSKQGYIKTLIRYDIEHDILTDNN